MQCAERMPRKMKLLIEEDLMRYLLHAAVTISLSTELPLRSPFTNARHHVLVRLSILFSWRFDISVQKFLSDRRYGRPFRNAGKPVRITASYADQCI